MMTPVLCFKTYLVSSFVFLFQVRLDTKYEKDLQEEQEKYVCTYLIIDGRGQRAKGLEISIIVFLY